MEAMRVYAALHGPTSCHTVAGLCPSGTAYLHSLKQQNVSTAQRPKPFGATVPFVSAVRIVTCAHMIFVCMLTSDHWVEIKPPRSS